MTLRQSSTEPLRELFELKEVVSTSFFRNVVPATEMYSWASSSRILIASWIDRISVSRRQRGIPFVAMSSRKFFRFLQISSLFISRVFPVRTEEEVIRSRNVCLDWLANPE